MRETCTCLQAVMEKEKVKMKRVEGLNKATDRYPEDRSSSDGMSLVKGERHFGDKKNRKWGEILRRKILGGLL